MISHAPLSGFSIIAFTGVEGHPQVDQKKDPPIGVGSVSTEYFRTMKIPLLSGRTYDARDRADAPKVAIVNQEFARRYFANGDPVGKHVGFSCAENQGLCRTIVGVVGNVRQESITDEVAPEMYLPATQMRMNEMTLLVRTTSDPRNLAPSVRNAVLAIDKNQPLYQVKTLAEHVDDRLAASRSLTLLFTAFALLGLILGAVGIYGIVSYSVTQRTHEIGIRMALGATARNVLSLIVKHGLALVLTGIVIGVGSDWDGQTARTLGPGQTLVSQYFATDGDTFWVQRTTDPVATAGTSVTINDTAPANHRYNLTIVEILLNP